MDILDIWLLSDNLFRILKERIFMIRVGIHKQFLNSAESLGFWNPRISAGFEPYS
jgi:hypothetical protein